MAEYIAKDKLWDTFVDKPFYDDADKNEIVLPIIDSFPAANVAPVVHAQWEAVALVEVDSHGETYRIPNAGLGCSWCMCAFDKNLLWRRSYCPNCGAKMDGGTT